MTDSGPHFNQKDGRKNMKFTAIEDMSRDELEEWRDKILELIGFRYVYTGVKSNEAESLLVFRIMTAISKKHQEEKERDRQNRDKYWEL